MSSDHGVTSYLKKQASRIIIVFPVRLLLLPVVPVHSVSSHLEAYHIRAELPDEF